MNINKTPQKIKNMFDEISGCYDFMNGFISFGMNYIVKYSVLKSAGFKPKDKVLDLCCGTGDFTKIISQISCDTRVIGADFSVKMLDIAKNKNPDKEFILCDCTDLPFENGEFDFVTIGFGLRNISRQNAALAQIYRVLKPDGIFIHLDFGNHNFASKVFDVFVKFFTKIFRKNACHYEYLINSKNEFPPPVELIKDFEAAGFELVKRKDFLFSAISAQYLRKIG